MLYHPLWKRSVGDSVMRMSFEEGRLLLARLHIGEGTRHREVLRQATRIGGRTLGVARVGVWFFDADQHRLTCELLYTTESDRYEEAHVLHERVAPHYFAALRRTRVLATHDAQNDEQTRELAPSYLGPRSIGAMLDAPIYRDGEVIGVVCHEHVGGPRTWQQSELDFAGSVADILAVLFLEERLRGVERQVRTLASLRQDAESLARLTEVTRAFAHDVNNALTVSMLVGSRLVEHPTPAEVHEMGEELLRASEFAGRLLRDLRAFHTRDITDRRTLREVVAAFQPVLAALLRDRAALHVDIDAPDVALTMSGTHVEQLLLNLCVNARDAGAQRIDVHITLRSPDEVEVEVRDDGSGIAPEVRSTMFEPYASTKPSGSGLGLTIVRTLVEQARGAIRVESEPGKGTTFAVRIPVA